MKPLLRIGIALLCLTTMLNLHPALAVDEARQEYNKMVEETTQEADEYLEEKQQAVQAAEKKSRIEKDKAFQEKIEAEREMINSQMNKVRERGLNPGYTQGMQDNLLQQWQESLDFLNSDPEAYFAAK